MVTHSKKTYLFIVSSLFIALILASNFYINNNFTTNVKEFENEKPSNKLLNDKPLSSGLNLTDHISGSGLNQTVRVYMVNASTSKNNRNYFDIPSPADKTYLSYGDFNFTFQNNYTTDYVIESNSSLYPQNFIENYKFNTNPIYSRVEIVPNMNKTRGSLYNLTDSKNLKSYWKLNSSTNGLLNFTVYANFSKIAAGHYVNFNRSKILGFLLSLSYNVSKAANLTVKMFDFNSLKWENVTTPKLINSTSIQYLSERPIDENLNYINAANTTLIQFIFSRTDTVEFNVTLFDFNINSTMGFELPITTNNQVALEFDLKGEKTTVNGFYAWIRALNLQKAANTSLNITLYQANGTVDRSIFGELQKNNIKPDYSKKIDSILVVNYTSDKLSYFAFNVGNAANLTLYNYYIVVRSNSSEAIYTLVTLPWYAYGDDATEQELKRSTDGGTNWNNAKLSIGSYTSGGQLDASQFKLNVTRGYIPSDFKIKNVITLNIQNITIEDYAIQNVGKSALTWGLGRWKTHNFTIPIANNTQLNFRVQLSWNNTIIKGFKFNVTYFAKSYRVENALSSYNASYNGAPMWTLNYTLNLKDPKFNDWNFSAFWFIYLDYLTPHNLTTPELQQVFSKTSGESVFLENAAYDKVVVTTNIVNRSNPTDYSGPYLLNLTSPNFIYRMKSYINYNGTLWETFGFMFGDNISLSVEIQDQYYKAPKNGTATVCLFYPNGTKYEGSELVSTNGSVLRAIPVLFYAFENRTILNVTNSIPVQGQYMLGYFWTNGSAIGCRSIPINISSYDIYNLNCIYSAKQDINILSGSVSHILDTYNLLYATVNETTGKSLPNFYPVNQSDLTEEFVYSFASQNFPVYLNSFLQNETILNPGEKVNFKIGVRNGHPFVDLNVKLRIQLVSYANPEWIIAESTSPTRLIKTIGDPSDTYTFNINLTIPTLQPDEIWKGVNAPIRKAGAMTLVTVYIEDKDVGTYDPQTYSLLVNQTDDQYEGYIYSFKTTLNATGPSLLKDFSREQCLYLPENTSFVINIYDQNYVSSYLQIEKTFSLKTNSTFTTPFCEPEHPTNGQSVHISSHLRTEFGTSLSGKSVSCSYYSGSSWHTLQSNTTNAQGLVTYDINSLDLDIEENSTWFKLSWNGDNYVNLNSLNFTISFTIQTNKLSINFEGKDKNVVYKNTEMMFSFTIENTGQSVLQIKSIDFDIDEDLDYKIVESNDILLNHLKPDESVIIKILVKIPDFDIRYFNITIKIKAQNTISTETFTEDLKIIFTVLDKDILDFFRDNLMIFIIAIFVLIWLLALVYARQTTKKLQKPATKEPEKKAPKRPKYVTVSELEAEKAAEVKQEREAHPIDLKEEEKLREAKKKPEQPEPDKKSTDLDALLEKEGLDKKKKSNLK